MNLLIIFCVVISCSIGYSKHITRCELANQLLMHRFDRKSLPDWVCLAESETQLKINTVSRRNRDGSASYGIFHINSRYWCKSPTGPSDANGCNIDCDRLVADGQDVNIAESAKCAMKIYKQSNNSFKPWKKWVAECEGKPLPNLEHCFWGKPSFNPPVDNTLL